LALPKLRIARTRPAVRARTANIPDRIPAQDFRDVRWSKCVNDSGEEIPARSFVEVAALPYGATVEIEAVAYRA